MRRNLQLYVLIYLNVACLKTKTGEAAEWTRKVCVFSKLNSNKIAHYYSRLGCNRRNSKIIKEIGGIFGTRYTVLFVQSIRCLDYLKFVIKAGLLE